MGSSEEVERQYDVMYKEEVDEADRNTSTKSEESQETALLDLNPASVLTGWLFSTLAIPVVNTILGNKKDKSKKPRRLATAEECLAHRRLMTRPNPHTRVHETLSDDI